MIEEIKLLLPVLESATNGAMWGLGLYFGFLTLKLLLTASIITFAIVKIAYLMKRAMNDGDIVDGREVHMVYHWNDKTNSAGCLRCYFPQDDMRELLRELADEDGNVFAHHIQDGIAVLRGLKETKK